MQQVLLRGSMCVWVQVNSKHGSEAERLEAAGSDAFKAKDWATAIRLYR